MEREVREVPLKVSLVVAAQRSEEVRQHTLSTVYSRLAR